MHMYMCMYGYRLHNPHRALRVLVTRRATGPGDRPAEYRAPRPEPLRIHPHLAGWCRGARRLIEPRPSSPAPQPPPAVPAHTGLQPGCIRLPSRSHRVAASACCACSAASAERARSAASACCASAARLSCSASRAAAAVTSSPTERASATKLALRRLLSAPDQALGCSKLQSASACSGTTESLSGDEPAG
eukprot:scaffold138682_cov127-Phaeocystis_antarctica.AAC.2